MLHCEYCEEAKPDVRKRWYEVVYLKFYDCDICDECNNRRDVPMIDERPSRGEGGHTAQEIDIIREWGELPDYWWRQKWT